MLMTCGAGFPSFSMVTSGARCSTLARRYSFRHRLGLELAGLLVDEFYRERDGFWVCLAFNAVEVESFIAKLLRVTKDRQHESFAVRLNADEMASTSHDHTDAALRDKLLDIRAQKAHRCRHRWAITAKGPGN